MVDNVKTSSQEVLQNLLDTSRDSREQVILFQILKMKTACALSFLKGVSASVTAEFCRGQDTLIELEDGWSALFQPGFRYKQAVHFLKCLDESSGESISSHTFSTPEDGTVFDDLFSIAKEKVEDGSITYEQSAPHELDPSDFSICIGDEDEAMLSILKGAFVSRGYKVQVFSLGKEILDTPAQVYLLGDDLKDMKGFDLITELRNRVGIDVPILLLTAGDADEISIEAFRHGASDCVQKPVNLSALIERTCHYLAVQP